MSNEKKKEIFYATSTTTILPHQIYKKIIIKKNPNFLFIVQVWGKF